MRPGSADRRFTSICKRLQTSCQPASISLRALYGRGQRYDLQQAFRTTPFRHPPCLLLSYKETVGFYYHQIFWPGITGIRLSHMEQALDFGLTLSTQEDLQYLKACVKACAALSIDPNTGKKVDNGVSGTEATRQYLTDRIKARGARV